MKRLFASLRYDLILQFRHKFYHVYAIVSLFYIVVLRLVPPHYRQVALPVVLFSDPGMLGFYFTAAIILFEKDARSLEAISVAPLRAGEYLWSKAISLSTLSILASLVVAAAVDGVSLRLIPLLLAVGLCGSAFVFIGVAFVGTLNSFSAFLLRSVPFLLLVSLPLAGYFGLFSSPLFYLLPSQPAIVAISGALGVGLSLEVLMHLGILLLWNYGLYWLARKRFVRAVWGGSR